MKGKANEDRYSVSAYRFNSDDHTPSVLALLADGIGGHHAGEVAAQLAVEHINKYVAESQLNQPAQVLKQALTYTNQIILDQSKEDPIPCWDGYHLCVCLGDWRPALCSLGR